MQGLHRLRLIRRQGETLLIFLITNLELSGVIKPEPGVTFTKRPSATFTKAAAPKKERTLNRVVAAIRELHLEGVNPSQRAVAERAGISKTQVLRQAGDGSWGTFVQLVLEQR